MLALLVACAAPTVDETGDVGDSQRPPDRGEPAPTAIDGPCGPWAGVGGVGTRWVYEPTDAYVADFGFDGAATVEVTAQVGSVFTLVEEGDYAGDSGSFTWSRVESWRCDADGAWWLRSDTETHLTSGSYTSDQAGWRTFEPGWLVRPSTLVDWSSTFTLTVAVGDAEPVVTDAACTTTVGTEAMVEVAGRTVAARPITPDCAGVGADPGVIGAGVGLVSTPEKELVDYSP